MTESNISTIHFDFLKSALCHEGHYIETIDVIAWLKEQNEAVNVSVNKVNFKDLDQWHFSMETGNLQHVSGRFFSIDGINVETNFGNVPRWEQPIINQPEIGYLGFIVKKIKGTLHFLLQAKIEPGNVNYVQLSPTLQATRSNYEQAHKGKKPAYLEYFQNARSEQILLDQLQSEQGARFLRKRNRNIIVQVEEEIPVYDNFTWLTLAQLKNLMQFDNLVNMDSRTVISGIHFGDFKSDVIDFFCFLGDTNKTKSLLLNSTLVNENALFSTEEIITFLTRLKSTKDLIVKKTSLQELNEWGVTNNEIRHSERKYFKIIAVNVEIDNREVTSWSQPMVEPAQEGLCAFVCKEINGVLHFAVQGKLECGNHDIIEFAPTVQTLTGNYKETKKGGLPFLEYVLNATDDQIFFDTLQSEEGGRFFKEQNRNMLVMADDKISVDLPPNFIWMTLNQLNVFLKFNNFVNIQARSLIAAISFT